MKKVIIPALILITTCSTSVITNAKGFYLGGEFGNTNLEITRLTIDDRAKSYGLYTGYHFNDWLALEGKVSKTENYHKNEEFLFEYEDSYGNERIARIHGQWNISTTTYSMAPKLTLELNDALSLYSKFGVNYTKLSMNGTVTLFDKTNFISHLGNKTEGWGYTLAAGLNTSLNQHLALHLGYEYAEADIKSDFGSKLKAKMSQFGLGLHYIF